VRAFLGLVRYIADFLPLLADHTSMLTPLTHKTADSEFPVWNTAHQTAFDAIKSLIVSRDCLTSIDHDQMGKNHIFVTCDASDCRTGAVLSYGLTWETAWPVAFNLIALKSAQLNYPVYEKELLAIIRALQKWRSDLLGAPITICIYRPPHFGEF
jgi:RNase H-like domain found in reverse transcriptase